MNAFMSQTNFRTAASFLIKIILAVVLVISVIPTAAFAWRTGTYRYGYISKYNQYLYSNTATTRTASVIESLTLNSDYSEATNFETVNDETFIYLDESIIWNYGSSQIVFSSSTGLRLYEESCTSNGNICSGVQYRSKILSIGDYVEFGNPNSGTPAYTITVKNGGWTSDGEYIDVVITCQYAYVERYRETLASRGSDYVCVLHLYEGQAIFDIITMESMQDKSMYEFNVSFYYAGTNELVDAAYVFQVTDLDVGAGEAGSEYNESFWFVDGFDNYVEITKSPESVLGCYRQRYTNNGAVGTSTYGYLTRLSCIEGVSESYANETLGSGFLTEITTGSFTFLWTGAGCGTQLSFSATTGYQTPDPDNPVKSTSNSVVKDGDTVTYTITTFIPYTTTSNYYSSLVFQDVLEDCFNVTSSTTSVNVYRMDVLNGATSYSSDNSNWTRSVASSSKTVKATCRYPSKAGGYYQFVITTKLKSSYDYSSYTVKNGYYQIPNVATMKYGSTTKSSNTVYIQTAKWTSKTETTYRERIYSVTSTDNCASYQWSGTLQNMWNNGITSFDYSHTTSPTETSESCEVTTVIYVIKETYTYDYNEATGAKKNESYSYSRARSTTYSKTYNYETIIPTITQAKFTPLNLNRNDYAQTGDGGLNATYTTGASGKIQASINNYRNITNNSSISALDINNDNIFYFQFNNSTFGMPSDYNWDNTVASLDNGTWEYVTNPGSGDYANGYNNTADDDGYLRYNLKFYASISNNTYNSNYVTASLTIDGDELIASSVLEKKYVSGMNWIGGSMSTRFTYIGNYYTDNNGASSNFAYWWVTTYSQSRFYEYGTTYYDTIKCYSGSKTSSSISSTTGFQGTTAQFGTITKSSSYTGGSDTITINANNNDRGLYVGVYTQNFDQPILYGHWQVATMAGALRLVS